MSRCAMTAILGLACVVPGGCSSTSGPGTGPDDGEPLQPVWKAAFDTATTGALSGVWGSSAEDVFVVGGLPGAGEIYHFDGTNWLAMDVPEVPFLVGVFGFGPDDVFAVGEDGGVAHYDGAAWGLLVCGTEADLRSVWGAAPDDLWVVGGDVGVGEPVIRHFDGATFTPVATPENDRGATWLCKVWGIGETCVDGACAAQTGADIQLWANPDGAYEPISEGGVLPVFRGQQGGKHTFLAFRAVGFDPSFQGLLTVTIARQDNGMALASTRTMLAVFTEIEPGLNEAQNVFWFFDGSAFGQIDGVSATITVTIEDMADASAAATLTQAVLLVEVPG